MTEWFVALRADWSRAMFDKSTSHGNDGDAIQLSLVFLFLTLPDFQGNSTEIDVETVYIVVNNKSTTIFHALYSYRL